MKGSGITATRASWLGWTRQPENSRKREKPSFRTTRKMTMLCLPPPNLEKSCSLCNEPIGHHVLQCSKETLQDTLKEVIHSTPVEPLMGPPKIVHPFPEIGPQTLLPPPPGIPANFSVKLNSITKMHTGPPPKEAHILTALTTQPKVMLKRMSPEEVQNYDSSA